MVKYRSKPEMRIKLSKKYKKKRANPDKMRVQYIPNVTYIVEPD